MSAFKDVVDDGVSWQGFLKEAATIGQLVGRATNGGTARAAKLPRAAEVLSPRFRKSAPKLAGVTGSLERAVGKVRGRGRLAARETGGIPRAIRDGDLTRKIDMSTVPSARPSHVVALTDQRNRGLRNAALAGAAGAGVSRLTQPRHEDRKKA